MVPLPQIQALGIPGVPLIETGDDIVSIFIQCLDQSQLRLLRGDVIAITSKIISKAEGQWIDLQTITPSEHAQEIAAVAGKDPREVELILREARSVSRFRQGVIVTEHRLGFISANSGVDRSNTRPNGDWRLLLPRDPDGTARRIQEQLATHFNVPLAVIIIDSHGRPFRLGTVEVAIGAAGLPALWNLRGQPDLFGQILHASEVALADQLAAAAGLLMGQSTEAIPIVILRGVIYPHDMDGRASDLVRPADHDMYR